MISLVRVKAAVRDETVGLGRRAVLSFSPRARDFGRKLKSVKVLNHCVCVGQDDLTSFMPYCLFRSSTGRR